MAAIDEIYTTHPSMGARSISKELPGRGMKAGRKRVGRLMKLMGLVAICPRPNPDPRSLQHACELASGVQAALISVEDPRAAVLLKSLLQRLYAEPRVKRVRQPPGDVRWCSENEVEIRYIQPGKPNQIAFIERFNRTYRNEVLNAYLFEDLGQVREISYEWTINYNERRPHDALGGLEPAVFRQKVTAGVSSFELSH